METNTTEVREFINIIVAQARAATRHLQEPGLLQMSRLHPADDDDAPVPSRYSLKESNIIERMIADAVADSNAGHNVYIEARTVRRELTGKKRGELEDTVAVFALVADSDADKRAGWTPATPISLTVETSPGNHHYWIFFETALDPKTAQALGDRLRVATGADSDTGTVTQPYRVAGTVNYPGRKKQERGRTNTPTRILAFDPEVLSTRERFQQDFPGLEQKTNGGGSAPHAAEPDDVNIPSDTMAVIRGDGPPIEKRGIAFWNVVLVLKELGFTVDGVLAILERHPEGIAKKYRGRLWRETKRAFDKIRIDPKVAAEAASTAPVFDPWDRYIVPAFPFEILPPEVHKFVSSQSTVIGSDPSGLAMSALTTFSGALHHGFQLKIQRHGNWFSRPRLWVLLVADVSARKTPTLRETTRPLVHYDAHQRVKYETDLRDWEEAKEQGRGETSLPKPKPPPRYLVRDTTIEKLAELLARSPKGILVLSDEISGWLGSMERYHTSSVRSERAFWNTAYDGGPHSVDRIKRGELFVPNLSVSLLCCIHPSRLNEIRGLTSDGLLQRCLPVMMASPNFPQDCECHTENYDELVRDLIQAQPAKLIMTDDALEVMNDLRQHLFNIEMASSGLALGFQAFVGKLHGIAGTLALILHMAHDPKLGATYAVEKHTAENVRKLLLEFILPHAFEFYRGVNSSNGEQLRRVASWILTSGTDRVCASDLMANVPDCRGLAVRDLQERVSPLVAAGWLEPESLGPTCNAWRVTPAVHAQLTERARAEEARKTAIADLMGWSRKGGSVH